MENLDSLRKKIEAIDMKIADLLVTRYEVVQQIGQIKKEKGLPICQKDREEELIKQISKYSNSDEKCKKYLDNVFRHIFSESCRVQESAK